MKTIQGTIIALPTPQTAKVRVVRQWQHPLYKKRVTRTKNYACHYETDQKVAVGDNVVIRESRPISKTKRFVIEKGTN